MVTSTGIYQISLNLNATVNDPQGTADIASVSYTLLGPSGDTPLATGTLTTAPPAAGTTQVNCTGVLGFTVTRAMAGIYHCAINAADRAGHVSATMSTRITIILGNSYPHLSSPGVRIVAQSGNDSTQVALSIAAADSNGVTDITLVTARAAGARDSADVAMFDDGLRSHGDAIAGDGIYSAFTWVVPRATIEEVSFQFRATDRAGHQSIPVERQVANAPPRFLSLNVPSTIQRPTSGTSLVSFFASVTDDNGLTDIDSVYFRNMTSASPVPVLMYDDGDITNHGDAVAHDGTYSRIVSIDASTTPGVKVFQFSVTDRAGARADTAKAITIN
jgi:hypothetical protein